MGQILHGSATTTEAVRLLYPGGSMVGVELARLRSGFLVSDAGAARREAGLLGGERAFQRIAQDVAKRFGIRFDQNMIFDLDVGETELVPAVMAVANAAKTAVENTALHLAATEMQITERICGIDCKASSAPHSRESLSLSRAHRPIAMTLMQR